MRRAVCCLSIAQCQIVTLSNMYVCSVQGAPHTLSVGMFMRDADVHEAAATGADDHGYGGGGGVGGAAMLPLC
jgi:hypothetical protein